MSQFNTERFQHLLQKWFSNTLTESEFDEFFILLDHERAVKIVSESILEDLHTGKLNAVVENELLKQKIAGRILAIIEKEKNDVIPLSTYSPLSVWRKRVSRLAAAAVLLIVSFSAAIYFLSPKSGHALDVQQHITQIIPAPEKNFARVIFANGTTVEADSITIDKKITKGGLEIKRLPGGELSYTVIPGINESRNEILTLLNPRGSKPLQIVLVDGTKVWLNADSKLSFPQRFEKERKVSVTGEGYFEVAKDKHRKFIVTTPSFETEVLGTHFDIKAFENDKNAKATLLEGSIRVLSSLRSGAKAKVLTPNQQALITKTTEVVQVADTSEVMAWKNELFVFNNTPINEIVEELSRWYNIPFTYKTVITDIHFNGKISRRKQLAEVLKLLESTEAIHFTIVNNRLIVSQ